MRVITADGYAHLYLPEHRLARKTGYVREHLVIAERALGKPIPPDAVVHHHNELRTDNANTNLVICEDEAYHKHIHWRMRTNGGTEKSCTLCGVLKPLSEFSPNPDRKYVEFRFSTRCKACRASIYQKRYHEKKGKTK